MFALIKVSDANGVSGQQVVFENTYSKSFGEKTEDEYIVSASIMSRSVTVSKDFKTVVSPIPNIYKIRSEKTGKTVWLTQSFFDKSFNGAIQNDHSVDIELWNCDGLVKAFSLGKITNSVVSFENGEFGDISVFKVDENDFGVIGLEFIYRGPKLIKVGNILIDPAKQDLYQRDIEVRPTCC